MNWINIQTSFLRSPEFMSATSSQQSAWLKLLGYCSDQENGGVIKGAKQWQAMQWCYACCVTFEEVSTSSPLWKWSGDDFILHAYPKSKEDEVRAKRDSGKRGGKHSGKARREALLRSTASPESEAQLRTERKGKERKIEGEEKENGKKVESDDSHNTLSDADWLKSLESDIAYKGINVQAEYSKMVNWCRTNNKQATRRRFINWLNRIEKPMQAPVNRNTGFIPGGLL